MTGGSPICSFPSHFCVLVVSSMGRPMSLLPSSKLGLKYSSGVMAVGLAWLSVCVISVCGTPRQGNGEVQPRGPPTHRDPQDTHPVVGTHVLFSDAQEGLQGGLTACRRGGGEDWSQHSPLPAQPAPAPPLLLPLCWSERCSVRVRVISSTLDAP